jgi:hypothetical protein
LVWRNAVIGSCPQCGRSIKPASGVGRPPTYCSVACRRSAAYEIARINNLLSSLEQRASDLRLTVERTGWEIPGEVLEAEIKLQRSRLLDLLSGDDENASTEG